MTTQNQTQNSTQYPNTNANDKKSPKKNKAVFLWIIAIVLVAVAVGVWVWIASNPNSQSAAEADTLKEVEGNPLFCNGLIPVMDVNGKMGYMNIEGELKVPYQYDSVLPMNNGIGRVMLDGNLGYVTDDGAELVPLGTYDYGWDFSEGFAWVRQNEKYGFINTQGELEIPLQYDEANSFQEGMAAICVDAKWGFINRQGEMVVEPIYTEVCDFKEGLAAVRLDGGWGYINKNGEVVIPTAYGVDNQYGGFSEGLALVRADGTVGFLNREGEMVISLSEKYQFALNFSEGMAPVGYSPKVFRYKLGFINHKGEEVVPPIYDAVEPFSEGFAVVKLDRKYGFINKQGEVAIPLIYEYASGFSGGAAIVKLDGKLGFVNAAGEYTMFPQYRDAEHLEADRFVNGFAWVSDGHNVGVVNQRGEEIVPIAYRNCLLYDDYILVIVPDKLCGRIYDYDGNIVLDEFHTHGDLSMLPFSNASSWSFRSTLFG